MGIPGEYTFVGDVPRCPGGCVYLSTRSPTVRNAKEHPKAELRSSLSEPGPGLLHLATHKDIQVDPWLETNDLGAVEGTIIASL